MASPPRDHHRGLGQAGADYLLAAKANHPTLRADIGACSNDAPEAPLDRFTENDKGTAGLNDAGSRCAADSTGCLGAADF